MAPEPLVGQSVLKFEALRSHKDTPQSVGLRLTRNRPDAKTSTSQHKTHKRQTLIPTGGIRTHNACKREAAEPRLRPRGL